MFLTLSCEASRLLAEPLPRPLRWRIQQAFQNNPRRICCELPRHARLKETNCENPGWAAHAFQGGATLPGSSGDLETQGVPIEPRWHSPAIQKCTRPPESTSGKPPTPHSGPQSNTIMTSKSVRKLQSAQKNYPELLPNAISTASGPWGKLPHRSPPHSICCCKSQ